MPVTPESRQSRREVKASIASQFWEQPVHSSKSLDGQLWALPAEPPALSLTGSSGLSRTQQLIAAQAARVPFFPSYDGSAEGVVLDRVLAKAGGRRWWTALSGRVKAQRIYNQTAGADTGKLDAIRDLSNYAVCARGRFQVGRRLTLNGMVEAPDADRLQRRLAQRLGECRQAATAGSSPGSGDGSTAGAAELAPPMDGADADADGPVAAAALAPTGRPLGRGAPAELEPCRAHATLRCALPGHDLSATAGYNLDYVDCTGDAAHVPLAVSLDLCSHDRADGLQYRVGLHQVTAPSTELATRPGTLQRWRTSLHAQGALAVEGEAHIWRGGSSKEAAGGAGKEAAGGATVAAAAAAAGVGQGQAIADDAAAKLQASGGGGSAGAKQGGSGEPWKARLASALDKAAAADEDAGTAAPHKQAGARRRAGSSAGAEGQPADGGEAGEGSSGRSQPGLSPGGPADGADGGSSPAAGGQAAGWQGSTAKLEQFIKPLEQLGEQVSGALHHITHPGPQHAQQGAEDAQQHVSAPGQQTQMATATTGDRPAGVAGSGQDGGGSGGSGSRAGAGSPLLGLSSQSITATIQDSVALLQQVRESVERLTSNVQEGSLQRLSQQLVDSRTAPPRRRPYSMLLAQPHLKLNAALGCLARMPLPALRAFSFPHASLEPLEHYSPAGGLPLASGSSSARHASTTSLASRASHSSHFAEAWQPYLKGTALRVFASAGLSGQLGRFSRPFLDYTAASARVDVGLTSPHVVGVVPDASALAAAAADGGHRPDTHRAFALEGRGAWHALSVSLAQQVIGPVRARVDARFALDPTSVPASEGERSTLKGVLQTALSVRPSLLEAVYGFDCVLPGTEGAARLAVWVSPKRRECMAELRLF